MAPPPYRGAVTSTLNPVQQAVLGALRVPEGWEPLEEGLADAAEARLEAALEPLLGRFSSDDPLRINKHALATVLGCEAFHAEQQRQPFAWNINTVRGTIIHKAVELHLNWRGETVPGEAVDAAITAIAENPRESASEFIDQLTPAELAELRGAVLAAVTSYIDSFPPLEPRWRPVVEYPARAELLDGQVVLNARMDLVIGHPGRKVIIDLKSGRLTQVHREDLRFYALIETLRTRQAPRLLASFSLDASRLDPEAVDAGVLEAAARRAAAGIVAAAELRLGDREPVVRPGVQCRWCPLSDRCDEGQRHLRALDGDEED